MIYSVTVVYKVSMEDKRGQRLTTHLVRLMSQHIDLHHLSRILEGKIQEGVNKSELPASAFLLLRVKKERKKITNAIVKKRLADEIGCRKMSFLS